MAVVADEDLVFNIVWTGNVFTSLRYFTASVLDSSAVRLRFLLNGCTPGQFELMERFADRWPGRVVEVLEISEEMLAHGVILDMVREIRHDGSYFAMIDPDIMALAPFTAPLRDLLVDHEVVSSGIEVWSRSNVVPRGHPGVAGEHFFTEDGFVFGGPHLTIYDRSVLDEVTGRWGVGLGSAGPELRDDTKAHLREAGHDYIVYDTGKVVAALVQADGHRLVHRDLPELVHVGGMSHFLAPPAYVEHEGEVVPDWVPLSPDSTRFEANKIAASMLIAAIDDAEPVTFPPTFGSELDERLELLGTQMRAVVDAYRSLV